MNKQIRYVFLLLFLFFESFSILSVKESSIFVDSTSNLTFNDAVQKNYHSFDPSLILDCSNCDHWIRFKIENKQKNKEANLLLTNYVRSGQLHYFCSDKKKFISTIRVGLQLPYPQYNTYFYPFLPFSISDSTSFYYFQFKIIDGKMIRAVNSGYSTLADTNYLMNYSTRQYIYVTFILSILLVVAFFTFIVFVKLKEMMYLWYFCYLSFASIFVLTIYNLPFRYFYDWHLNLWHIYNTFAFFYSLMTISLLLYTQAFFNLKSVSKKMYFLILGMAFLKFTFFLLGVLFNESLTEWSGTNIFFHNAVIDFCCLIPAFVIGIYRFIKGDKFALYFLLAFGLIITGFIVHSFGLTLKLSLIKELKTGFVSNTFFDLISIEVLFFTIGLAERFRQLKNGKDQALQHMIIQLEENAILRDTINRELEQKVVERTKELQPQAQEIIRMNTVLSKNNLKLERDVQDLSKARVTHKPVSLEEFKNNYPDELSCHKYIADLKWAKTYTCRKCKNTTFIEGKLHFSHRCNKCWYDETPTNGTVFHKLKFPIEKAFYLLYLVTSQPNISIEELSKILSLSNRTCWSYKNKIQEAIVSRKLNKKYNGSWDSIILN